MLGCPPLNGPGHSELILLHDVILQMTYEGQSIPVAIKSVDVTCSDQDASNFERVYAEVTTLSSLQGLDGVIELLDFGLSYTSSGGHTSSRSRAARYHLVFHRWDLGCSFTFYDRSHHVSKLTSAIWGLICMWSKPFSEL